MTPDPANTLTAAPCATGETPLLQAALDYAAQGLHVFPCRGKHPYVKGGFKAASTDPDQLRQWWALWPTASIGVATGAISGLSVVDVDIDPEQGKDGRLAFQALQAQHGALPPTRITRTPRGGWHYWFWHKPGITCSTSKLGAWVDTRGDGGYVVAPPSSTARGDYTWENPEQDIADAPDWLPALLTPPPAVLKEKATPSCVKKPAAAARATQVADALNAVSPDVPYLQWVEVGMALHAWCPERGLPLWLEWCAKGQKHVEGEPAAKWASFATAGAEKAGITVATLFHHAQAAGWAPKDAAPPHVARLNQTLFLTYMGSQAVVGREDPDGGVVFCKRADVATYLANDHYIDDEGKRRPSFEAWITASKRRTYKRVVFAPGLDTDGTYNLYRGMGVTPASGKWSLMEAHLREVFCAGNDDHYAWLTAWMAHAVQCPGGDLPGTAVISRGIEGAGKGIVADQFGQLFGRHYRHLTSPGQLVGRFNSHLRDALLVFADEAFFAGDRSVAGQLKGLITERWITTEQKFGDALQTENHARIIMASNEDWVVAAGADARRYFVLEASPHRAGDSQYFKALADELNTGGREAWMHHLMGVDWRQHDLRNCPKTAALTRQKMASLDPVDAYWQTCLDEGAVLTADVDGRDTTDTEAWLPEVLARAMHTGYLVFCRLHGRKHPHDANIFFRVLRDHTGHQFATHQPRAEGCKRMVDIPPIDEARASWAARIGGNVDRAPF